MIAREQVDSLQRVFELRQDAKALEAGLELCAYFEEEDVDSMLYYALKTAELAEGLGERELLFQAYQKLADAHYYLSKYNESTYYLKQSSLLAIELNKSPALLGECYNNIGYNYNITSELDSAFYYYTLSEAFFRESGDSSSRASVLGNIGNIWFKRGKYEQSLDFFMQSYQIDSLIQNEGGLMSTYNDMGRVLVELEKYETGIVYYRQSIALTEKYQRPDLAAIRHNNIGMAQYQLGRHEEAIQSFTRAIQMEEELGNIRNLGTRYNNLGLCYEATGDDVGATEYYTKSIVAYEEVLNNFDIAYPHINLAGLLLENRAFTLAESHLQKAIQIGETSGSLDIKGRVFSKLYVLETERSNHKKANEWMLLLLENRKEIYDLEVARTAEELEEVYQTREKEAEIHQLEQVRELQVLKLGYRARQRNRAIFIAFLAVLVAIAMIFLVRKVSAQNKKLNRLNATMNRMFSIISHDMRGAIGSYQSTGRILKHQIRKNHFDELPEIADAISTNANQLSHMLDNLLNWALAQIKLVHVHPEEIHLSDYLSGELELYKNIAMAKEIDLQLRISDDLSVYMDKDHLSLILRNLLSNAIKFSSQGNILVSGEKKEGLLILYIEDHGVGMDEKTLQSLFDLETNKIKAGTNKERGTGLGLNLVKEYVELNGGTISAESKTGKGTKFTIVLPSAR